MISYNIILYLAAGFVIVLLAFLYARSRVNRLRKKRLEMIRESWGKPKNEAFLFDRIDKYASVSGEKEFHQLSNQTIDDIDFYRLFEFLDRTTSRIGQQFLFRKLIQPGSNSDDLKRLSERADELNGNASLRESIQKELIRLNNNNAYYITSLMEDKLLEKPVWFNYLFLDILVVVTLLGLSFRFPILLLFLIIPVIINMIIHYWNKSNAMRFVKSFPQLNLLISISERMMKIYPNQNPGDIEKSIKDLSSFKRNSTILNLTQTGDIRDDLSQIGLYFVELIKIFFLVEIFTLFYLIRELETKKSSVTTLYRYIGEIDTAISIASLRAGSKTCRPTFINNGKSLRAVSLYHPLIVNCVENNITVNGKSVLITGSNMSGKTTFLRTVMINSILAQTLYTCFAEEFNAPILKQFSSIRIDDSLLEGKSYYYEEVNIMASLIEEAKSGNQNLFILDEVFKGTNTVERIASAKAILSYLNGGNNIVIVSTHDIELSALLNQEYDLYHFTETIEDQQLHFDHMIKPGSLTTRNGIRILELSGYPKEIIDEAKRLSS
ncbi:MAG: DNA mismatch repair protein MutS [Cyclobacteriaceae bacterium]|nr:DNA mismatch repair protein MutS [Cyclobacteriaceae bacterium]